MAKNIFIIILLCIELLYKIKVKILFVLFFCLANIYRPSLGQVWLGRPNWKPIQLQFSSPKKKKHSSQNCMHCNGMMPSFQFWFSFIFKKILKFWSKKMVTFFNYIYNSSFNFLLLKIEHHSIVMKSLMSTIYFIHHVVMDNERLKLFSNFKSPTSGKCIPINNFN